MLVNFFLGCGGKWDVIIFCIFFEEIVIICNFEYDIVLLGYIFSGEVKIDD